MQGMSTWLGPRPAGARWRPRLLTGAVVPVQRAERLGQKQSRQGKPLQGRAEGKPPCFCETFALPYHHKPHQRGQELGVKRFGFHICCDQNKNLPALADAALWPHPFLLNFGHEVDLAWIFHEGSVSWLFYIAGVTFPEFGTCMRFL